MKISRLKKELLFSFLISGTFIYGGEVEKLVKFDSGGEASATGHVAIGIGPNSKANGNQALAIGANAEAVAETNEDGNMMALGLNSKSTNPCASGPKS